MIRKRKVQYAFTLVELLTVLGVVTLLAAIVLPGVKSLLVGRKTGQAAIVVKNFLEAGRARAIGKNRSVAVVLERLSSRPLDRDENGVINIADTLPDSVTGFPRFQSGTANGFLPSTRTTQLPDTNFLPYNTCIKLSLAEEPIAVTNKTIPAPVIIQAQSVFSLPTTDYVGPEILADPDQASWELPNPPFRPTATPEERTFSVSVVDPSTGTVAANANAFLLLGEYLVAGNEISFGDSSQRFTIASPTFSQTHENYENRDAIGRIWFSIYNERGAVALNEQALRSYSNVNLPSLPIEPTSFRIYQRPKPIYSQTVDLPKGSCIDLSLSGLANNRPGLGGTLGVGDYRVRFSSDWVLAGANGVPTPQELRPVYLVFSPDGSFSRIYANEAAGGETVRIDAVDDVFLHVGKIDQVYMPILSPSVVRNRNSAIAAESAGIKQNLTDPDTYVVRISPKSGAIGASPIRLFSVNELGSTETLFDMINRTRTGAYSTTATGQ